MRRHVKKPLSFVLGAVLLAGFLVALSHTAPRQNIDTIRTVGYGGTSSARTAGRTATFARPDVGEWFRPGPHHSGRIFSGSWFWQKHDNWWCINFSKHSGDGMHNVTVHSKLPGFTTANSKSALKVMNAETTLVARVTGLSAVRKINSTKSWVIWFLSGDKALHADWKGYAAQLKGHGELGAFNKLLAWGRNHGPYTVVVKAPKVSVGQTGHGSVTVKAANGNAASNLQVSLSGNDNVKLSTQGGMTNSNGQLSFKYKVTDFGRVTVQANVSAPSSSVGLLTDASPGRQKLLTGHYNEHASGHTGFRTKAGVVEMTKQCTTDCKGIATVTWTGKVPAGSKPMRFKFEVDGNVVARCDGTATKNCQDTAQVADGKHWTGYDFCTLDNVGGNCISAYTHIKRDKEIICPPVPTADVKQVNEIHCPCDGSPTLTGTIEATVTSLAGSPRFFKATLTDATTGDSKTVDLTNGTPNTFDVPFFNGDEYILTYQVYDHSGGTLLKQGQLMDATFNTTLN